MEEKSTSEGRESCYFPECQKDTNCKCEMCLASINATLDLVSSRGSSLKEKKQMSITLSSYIKTPKQRKDSVGLTATPLHWSTARSKPTEKKMIEVEEKEDEDEDKEEKRSNKVYLGRGCRFAMWVYAISMAFTIDLVFPTVRTTVIGGTKMSADMVKTVGEEVDGICSDLRKKIIFLEKSLGDVSGENISNCCSSNSNNWKLDRNDGLLHLRCTLYANQLEEVLVWGFPVQTAGVLTTGLSNRSFTIISGKLYEWSNVELEFKVRNQGESWTSVGGRTSSNSAVKLSESTWILEYHRSPLVQKSLLVPLVWEWMCFRAAQVVDELTRFQWLLPKPSSLSSATLASPPPT